MVANWTIEALDVLLWLDELRAWKMTIYDPHADATDVGNSENKLQDSVPVIAVRTITDVLSESLQIPPDGKEKDAVFHVIYAQMAYSKSRRRTATCLPELEWSCPALC